jgi:hypothetical protein
MSGVTVDGKPWGEHRPWADGPTMDELNTKALVPISREHGYCLCIHPMSEIIDFTGLSCDWCGQLVTKESVSDEARQLRGAAILAVFPELRKTDA